ncbi:MAG: MFS transporter [Planctomycetota bacterium]
MLIAVLKAAPETVRNMRPAARAYLFGSACMGAASAVTMTFLARWLNLLGTTKTEIGTFQSLDSWGKVVIALPAAFVLARRPARGVFVSSALVAGTVYFFLPFLPSLEWMYAANFIAGLAMTVHYVAIAPFLFRHTSDQDRADVFSLAEAARTLAAVIGAGLAGFAVARLEGLAGSEADATSVVVSGAGGFALLAALFYSRIHDPEPSMAGGQRVLPAVVENRALLARFAAPQFLIATGAGFCIPFLPTYFQERFDVPADGWGFLFAAGQILMTLGFLLTPLALRRFGFVSSMVLIELASLPFFLMLAFTTSLPVAMFAFLMRGALMNATHPILKNLMMRATPAGVREVQTGVNAMLWGIGWVVGPLLAGRVLDSTGDDYSILMCTTVGMYVAAATLTFLLLRSVEASVEGGGAEPTPGRAAA